MPFSPLDLQRLAVRIERLKHTDYRSWRGGDDLEFKNLLPGGYDRRALPDPKTLRAMADKGESPPESDWRLWVTMALRMEGMITQNDPRNPRNMMRDMMEGRGPGGWRR